MATTYELIASVTVGSGGAANIEFTSIPATYTDLVVLLSARNIISGNFHTLDFRMNGLTTSIYSARTIYGLNGSAFSASETNITFAARQYGQGDSATANTFGNIEFYFPNYASSNNKSVSVDYATENNATEAILGLNAVLMASSAAITSLSFFDRSANNFMQYSTAYLYGISNA